MDKRLSIGFDWQGNKDREETYKRVKIADDVGIDTVFVSEAWGQDAFTMLALLADRTSRCKLATGVVNYYSRTPAALAQHFGTLDELSEGRMVIGLGASSANVIEHFHGVKFNPPLQRMRETVEIINTLIANKPLNYKGKIFDLQRGFTLRFKPYRDHIPVWIASFRPRAVKTVAEIADGWLPMMIPIGSMRQQVDQYNAWVRAAGRDPSQMTVRASGAIVMTKNVEKVKDVAKARIAFYVARMGDYYYEQLCDMGFAETCDEVRRAWRESGSKAAYAAVTDELNDALNMAGDIGQCRERIAEQEAAGVNLHTVSVEGAESALEEGRIFEALMK